MATLILDFHKRVQTRKRMFDLSVHVESSAPWTVFYGPSGAGKSLTLQTMAGLLRPDAGRIQVQERVWFDQMQGLSLSPQERRVGYLWQDSLLFPHLTVRQNIAFACQRGFFNPRMQVQDERVEYWLRAFDLEKIEGQYPHQISGGQGQRTALAQAVVQEPRALLLDEPFSALDHALRQSLKEELLRLQNLLQIPMVMVSHNEEDWRGMQAEVFQMESGNMPAPK